MLETNKTKQLTVCKTHFVHDRVNIIMNSKKSLPNRHSELLLHTAEFLEENVCCIIKVVFSILKQPTITMDMNYSISILSRHSGKICIIFR
jgi:hypothetical protein